MKPLEPAKSDTEWLLEKIAVIARAWRTVLLVALAVAAIGGAGVLLTRTPPTFTSTATLPLNPFMRALLAHQGIAVSAELSKGSGLFRISATDRDPDAAREKLAAIVTGLASAWEGSAVRRAQNAQSEILRTALRELESMRRALPESVKPSDPDLADRIKTLVDIDGRIVQYRQELLDIENAGLSSEDLIVRPSRPVQDPQRSLLAKLAAVLAISIGFAVAFVAIWHELFPQRFARA